MACSVSFDTQPKSNSSIPPVLLLLLLPPHSLSLPKQLASKHLYLSEARDGAQQNNEINPIHPLRPCCTSASPTRAVLFHKPHQHQKSLGFVHLFISSCQWLEENPSGKSVQTPGGKWEGKRGSKEGGGARVLRYSHCTERLLQLVEVPAYLKEAPTGPGHWTT